MTTALPPLGFLDLCKCGPNESPRVAVQKTIALATAADRLGFRRFWLAEHHVNNSSITAPEVLLGVIGERTSRLRLGFGGIVMRYYSPWRVSEIARSLQTVLGPRLDLGLCRGPALIDARIADELVSGNAWELDEPWHEHKIAHTVRLLMRDDVHGKLPTLRPLVNEVAETWVLGSSTGSAKTAAMLHVSFAIPHFIIRDEQRVRDSLIPFLNNTSSAQQRAIVAVSVVGGKTSGEANEREAQQIASGSIPSNLVGSWADVSDKLSQLTATTRVDEIMLTSFAFDADRRLEIVEELAAR